jgi:hypothetical protein
MKPSGSRPRLFAPQDLPAHFAVRHPDVEFNVAVWRLVAKGESPRHEAAVSDEIKHASHQRRGRHRRAGTACYRPHSDLGHNAGTNPKSSAAIAMLCLDRREGGLITLPGQNGSPSSFSVINISIRAPPFPTPPRHQDPYPPPPRSSCSI